MTMYRRILLATDYSLTSAAALVHAARLAQRDGAELHVLHVRSAMRDLLSPDAPDHGATDDVVGDHELRSWIRASGYEQHISVTRVASGGRMAAPHILSYAKRNDIDLIVVGSHGRGGISAKLLGSEAETVLREAGCDVLIARHDAPQRPVRRILAPVDLSAHSREALIKAGELAVHHGASLTALMVIEPLHLPPYLPVALVEQAERENAEAALNGFVDDAGLTVAVTRTLARGRTHRVIVEQIIANGVDLVVMASAGRSGIDRLFTGSVTSRVVQSAPCAVLVHRAVEDAEVEYRSQTSASA